MKSICSSVALLGFLAPFAAAEGIIGYDGKEHHWHPHRDGIHDQALHGFHQREAHRRYDLKHPRLRRIDAHQLPHMLNQAIGIRRAHAPIVVKQHNLRIASRTVSHRFGADASSQTIAAATGNATQDSAMGLSRMEQNLMDSVYGGYAANEGKRSVTRRVQNFHFHSRKQTEQNAAEELTAQEVRREQRERHRAHRRIAGAAPAPGVVGGAPAAAASGPSPAPAPAASPAVAPAAAGPAQEEHNDMFSMDEDLGAQEQGFSGKIVEHDDMKSMTKDWHSEYGPGQDSYHKICALYPNNQWCRDRGYHHTTPRPKSAAMRSAGAVVLVLASFGLLLA